MKEPNKQVVRKRQHLSAEEKYQIFLEAAIAKGKGNGEIDEVVRGVFMQAISRGYARAWKKPPSVSSRRGEAGSRR